MNNLLIIRTPFQAWLAERVLEKEKIDNFDLIYFTHNNSIEDTHYYKKLALKANKSEYIFVLPQRINILSLITFKIRSRSWYNYCQYNIILCASIDSFYITSLIRSNRNCRLITFDDGTSNIDTKSSYSYFQESKSVRDRFYRFLLNALSLSQVKSLIDRHYTMYDGYENIVDSSKLVFLDKLKRPTYKKNNATKTYFIGTPFEEIMSDKEIKKLEGFLKNWEFSAYVAHPRETRLLKIGAKTLDKKGQIAEEAILEDAKDSSIILIGGNLSSVMLNIGHVCQEVRVILPHEAKITPNISEMSIESGFKVTLI